MIGQVWDLSAMVASGYFSSAAREREKQEARERDERLIANGKVSADQLAKRNGLFSALDPSKARIVRRRAPVRVA
jgi:hypothetical protein